MWVRALSVCFRSSILLGLVPQEGDEIVSVFAFLETAEGHLCAGDVFLGVLEVFELFERGDG